MATKYPRGKIEFHQKDILENLDAFYDALYDSNLVLEELSLEDTFNEIRELVARSIAQPPTGEGWYRVDGKNGACPRCPCCGAQVKIPTGKRYQWGVKAIRDQHCSKCGQKIDWTEYLKKF